MHRFYCLFDCLKWRFCMDFAWKQLLFKGGRQIDRGAPKENNKAKRPLLLYVLVASSTYLRDSAHIYIYVHSSRTRTGSPQAACHRTPVMYHLASRASQV